MTELIRKYQKAVFPRVLLFLMFCLCFVGCWQKDKDTKREDTISFEVCDADKIPEELKRIIEEKMQHSFAVSYISENDMYIAVGYGAHDVRDLYVVVEEFYRTKKAAYLDTNLLTSKMTPSDKEAMGACSMNPYIVIKCERLSVPIYYNAP